MNTEARIGELLSRNPKLRDEILELADRDEIPELHEHGLARDEFVGAVREKHGGEVRKLAVVAPPRGTREAPAVVTEPPGPRAVEAIVRKYGRPVLLIRNGTYEAPKLRSVMAELAPHKPRIDEAIKRVGRVEFLNHAMPWGGTGWLVDRKIVITNRHVAEIVAENDFRGGYRFRMSAAGVPYQAKIDWREEYRGAAEEELPLKRVRYLARADQPDIALLEIETDGPLPDPLPLSDKAAETDQEVGIIGYPAYDSRNDPDDVARYFGNIFDVKRLSPGRITQPPGEQAFFMHDATTLGGNSGSVVFDMETGRAVGLHFAGSYLQGNFALTVRQIKRALRGLGALVAVPEQLASGLEARDGSHEAKHFKGRTGYDPLHLGKGALRVPLPGLQGREGDAAEAVLPGGKKTRFLPYTHFSVAFSASRKVPIFTAVNIDGSRWKKIKRASNQWFSDLRLPQALQLGEKDYAHPAIDRGHMVRREDPNWGTMAVARLGNEDTFHYTNAAPQHEKLNQSKAQWLGLEDYVLENARTHGLLASVFTGPVLRDSDPRLENGVQVPEDFWKVVAAVDQETRRVRATGYVLSQGRFIEDITEGFVYGEYRTYQVPVAKIAEATGLDFGKLVDADPLKTRPVPEATPGVPPVIALDRLEAMVL